jgi:tRNA G10  N-methylase Trm11
MNTPKSLEKCDGLEYIQKFSDNTINLILIDPPYGISNTKNIKNEFF